MKKKKDENKATGKKIAGTLKAASATVAGVAFLRSKTGNRFVSEVFPAVGKTYRNITDDLIKTKSRTKKIKASDLERTFKSNIGKNGEVFLKEIEKNRRLPGEKLSDFGRKTKAFSTEGKQGFVGRLLQIKRLDEKYLEREAINSKRTKLKDKYIGNELLERFKGKYTENQIHQIIDATYNSIEKGVIEDNDVISILPSYKKEIIKKIGVDNKDKNLILSHIYSMKKNVIEKEAKKVNVTEAKKQLDEIIENTKAIKSNSDGYIYNRIDKFLNKHFNIKVDSEELLTGSKALRLKDLDEEDIKGLKEISYSLGSGKNKKTINLGNEIEALLKKDKDEYGDIILDKSLRIRRSNGKAEVFSTDYYDKFIESKRKSFSSSLLGKVLYAGIDFEDQINKPFSTMIKSGKISSFAKNALLEDSYLYLNGKAYKFTGGETGFNLEKGIDVNLVSSKHGKSARILRNTFGSTRVSLNDSESEIFKKLDIGQNGKSNIFKNVLSNIFGKEDEVNEHQSARRLKYAIKNNEYIKLGIVNGEYTSPAELYDDMVVMSKMFDYHINKNMINEDTYNQIVDSLAENSVLKKIMESAANDDLSIDEIFEQIRKNENNLSKDGKLSQLLNIYNENPDAIHNYLNINSNPENIIPILDMPMATTNVLGIRNIVKNAALEEYVLKNEFANKAEFYDALKHLDLSDRQRNSLDAIIFNSNLKKVINRFDRNKLDINTDQGLNLMLDSLGEFNKNTTKSINIINSVEKDFNILNKGSISKGYKSYEEDEYNSYDIIRKSSLGDVIKNAFDYFTNPNSSLTGESLIQNINNTIKEVSVGGRKDKEHFTPLTMFAQYSMQRLSMGVEEVGLGLSSDSLASPIDTFKNIALKRVLPAMLAYNTLDYLNFESRNFTGVSLTGAAANVISNTDLAVRNIADHTGIGFLYNGFKSTSVIAEYITGSSEYQDRDEREEWYKNGESVVRKARFWSFGSSSEFRGTSISYYQPNYLRRAHSNWKEVGIYGDPDEKWKHSIIPSIRHPLSPIRYLLDPYWLEKKNFDERPYPLTGKMFSEGTPWGAILNPTVGEIIKPVRMLPKARRRLKRGRAGEDINNVLYRINKRIKNKKDKSNDMIVITGTSIKNAEYVPFGHPTDDEFNVVAGRSQGINYMNTLYNASTYNPPNGTTYNEDGQANFNGYTPTKEYRSKTRKKLDMLTAELFKNSVSGNIGQNIISSINDGIKGGTSIRYQSNLPDEGVYIYKNLVRDKKKADLQYYENKENKNRIDKSKARDAIRDAKYSISQLSGIYGFLGGTLFGSDEKTFRYENAGQMTSFSRGFWDSSIGGLGGGLMEISRRFFPSTNKSIVNVNPLRNNMASWLPDSYRMGDPFVKIPKGEMRLPGKGYETLNELHPDQFATDGYGAFDRFKILSDVAPYSDEYKIWKKIAKQTIQDQELKNKIEEIEERVAKKSGDHEFFEYRYFKNRTDLKDGVVKKVSSNGTIELQNGEVLTLAGLKPVSEEKQQYQTQTIYDFIKPGDKINYETPKDAITNLDDLTTVNKAIIYKKYNGLFGTRNISKELLDAGIMERDEKDKTPIAELAKASTFGKGIGMIQEVIAHAPIPFVHNKFLKVETALESYKNEQVYGSSFQTWDHPIEGFIKPILNKSFSASSLQKAAAIGIGINHYKNVINESKSSKVFLSGLALATAEPASFLFGALNWGFRLNDGFVSNEKHVTKRSSELGAYSRGAKLGATIGTVGWAITNAKNPIKAAMSFGIASMSISEYLEDTAEVLERNLPKKILDSKLFKGNVTTAKIGVAGATIGLGVSAIRNIKDPSNPFGKWIPKKTKNKYDLDEYFDRLNYIKYEGLYHKAVRKASVQERSNIGYIFKQLDKNKKKIGKLKKKALELSNKHMIGSYEYNEKIQDIKNKIASLEEQQQVVFNAGGKYTKAAIAYKKAADSTIYGLNEGSSREDIMTAIPTQYKDHFMAFMNETDSKKRKEILSYMPKYLQKPLKIAWGEDYEVRSNARYFKKKRLPNASWKGWKPNINMDHVKMKTIESEGMLLSDFGYYESEKSKAQYAHAAPVKKRKKHGTTLGVRAKLISTMQGVGMPFQNISVEETSSPGISIFGDFQQQAQDVISLASYI